ncbi:MAG: tRNA (N6-threonylcarbamoyladenosine(37)-N6)-methyltransferase TrmO [Candidatus Fermentibacteraceae bacterium]|nr:tRNA (N6-threonylcarbamoyladenosine(37)-N6)-methyltransferase TrmO [Candidatus Fermentibacteraceae bacterium]
MNKIVYRAIGTIHTPYTDMAPFQAVEDDSEGPFILELLPEYETALKDLEHFKYVIVLFHMDRVKGYNGSNVAHPPSLRGGTVGLFASRSPNRPNPIGLDVARILRIEGNSIYTSGLSALDGTPLIDIKPYTRKDSKPDPGNGWMRNH